MRGRGRRVRCDRGQRRRGGRRGGRLGPQLGAPAKIDTVQGWGDVSTERSSWCVPSTCVASVSVLGPTPFSASVLRAHVSMGNLGGAAHVCTRCGLVGSVHRHARCTLPRVLAGSTTPTGGNLLDVSCTHTGPERSESVHESADACSHPPEHVRPTLVPCPWRYTLSETFGTEVDRFRFVPRPLWRGRCRIGGTRAVVVVLRHSKIAARILHTMCRKHPHAVVAHRVGV